MSQIGRQHRQSSFAILAGSIPSHQCPDCESVAKIVQARPVSIRGASQTDLAREAVESAPYVRTLEGSSAIVHQKAGCAACAQIPIAASRVMRQYPGGRYMQWYQ